MSQALAFRGGSEPQDVIELGALRHTGEKGSCKGVAVAMETDSSRSQAQGLWHSWTDVRARSSVLFGDRGTCPHEDGVFLSKAESNTSALKGLADVPLFD